MTNSPNLLFIYTDEQAFNTLACYGNSQIDMPNLNRLAERSVVFDQTYVTQSVCTPSRSSLLTGQYPHTNGCIENNVALKQETPCLPEMVTQGEYSTGHHGKWHLGDELFAQHGFDDWVSLEDMYNGFFSDGRDRDACSDYSQFLKDKGIMPDSGGNHFGRIQCAKLPEKLSKPAFLANTASEFIRDNRDNPFILYVNFLEPHMPFCGPRDNQYPADTVPLPGNFEAPPTDDQPLKARLLHEQYKRKGVPGPQQPLDTPADWQQLRAQYWGLCSQVDTHVGTILDTLEETGQADNTIIVFTSDHGDMMGSHQIVAKCLQFEEAVRVPFLISLPGQTEQKRVMGPVSQIDIVPTLLDLMGQPVPDHLQGKSLRPWMDNPAMTHEETVVIEWNGGNNGLGDVKGTVQIPEWMTDIASPDEIAAASTDAVRTVITADNWKLSWSPMGCHELYNLKDDPNELTNLYGRSECAGKVAELVNSIVEWQARSADEVELPAAPTA